MKIPRYIRCYDNGGESFDRYTVVFTGKRARPASFPYLGMSAHPFQPQGFGQHGEGKGYFIDRPSGGHLGRRTSFDKLPEDCQRLVLSDYRDLWGEKAPMKFV